MRKIPQFIRCVLLLALFNCAAWWEIGGAKPLKAVLIAALIIHYLVFLILPQFKDKSEKMTPLLTRLKNGACILGYGRLFIWLELAAIIAFAVCTDLSPLRQAANGITAYLLIFVLNLAGIARVASSSRQVKPYMYLLLFFTWYIPIINSLVLRSFFKTARSEYRFEQAKLDLDDMRAENHICQTKYPILMVHGIFFRDWQVFNYWGRIPKELARNGAQVYYARQQSANTIERSAGEIADSIRRILAETGAEKVNIIAHSKGGLDSRYAVSRLGMDKYVASLTTINTPHLGCEWVDNVLKKVPRSFAESLDRKYNSLFTKLGDNDPHFLLGVNELTKASCAEFNRLTPDMPDVRYHSIMSRMTTPRSAGFPLNMGYYLCKPFDKQGNDGLVGVESGLYWEQHSMIPDTRGRGISHGDVIDLMRENVEGFDVREFYVKLAEELKNSGL